MALPRGLAPAAYLLRRRVELARHALEREGGSIASIAGTTPDRFRLGARAGPE